MGKLEIAKKTGCVARIAALALTLLAGLPAHAAPDMTASGGKVLILAADSWCPYNCTPTDPQPGYLVELAIRIYGSKGYRVDYQVMPWKRVIEMTKVGQIDGVLAVCDIEATGLVKTEKPVGIMQNMVATMADKKFEWTGVNVIGTRRAGMINGYGYGDDLLAWAAAHPEQVDYSTGAEALEAMLNKLIVGRIDFLQDDIHVLEYRLAKMGLKKKIFLQPEGEHYPLRIAFSPVRPDGLKLAKMFDDGIAQMRRTGELARLLKRYGMKDWQNTSKKKH